MNTEASNQCFVSPLAYCLTFCIETLDEVHFCVFTCVNAQVMCVDICMGLCLGSTPVRVCSAKMLRLGFQLSLAAISDKRGDEVLVSTMPTLSGGFHPK